MQTVAFVIVFVIQKTNSTLMNDKQAIGFFIWPEMYAYTLNWSE